MSQDQEPSEQRAGIVCRPPGQLESLPLEIRWEVSRRHPYYLLNWRWADRALIGQDDRAEAERLMAMMARCFLRAIGVTGRAVDPATEFAGLGAENLHPAWLRGAVRPLTFRGMVGTLLCQLGPAESAVVGALLLNAGSAEYAMEGDDENRSLQIHRALDRLSQIVSPELDFYPDAPLCWIEPEASQRTIAADLDAIVRDWKQRRNIPERRIRPETLKDQLLVWDQREGWNGSNYEGGLERAFRDISVELSEPLPTVTSRYRAAFKLITGNDFSPELWFRIIGVPKLAGLFGDDSQEFVLAFRRRLRSNSPRPVPESVLRPRPDEGSRPDDGLTPASGAGLEEAELKWDLDDLIARGFTDEQIAVELEISEETVSWYRSRGGEFAGF